MSSQFFQSEEDSAAIQLDFFSPTNDQGILWEELRDFQEEIIEEYKRVISNRFDANPLGDEEGGEALPLLNRSRKTVSNKGRMTVAWLGVLTLTALGALPYVYAGFDVPEALRRTRKHLKEPNSLRGLMDALLKLPDGLVQVVISVSAGGINVLQLADGLIQGVNGLKFVYSSGCRKWFKKKCQSPLVFFSQITWIVPNIIGCAPLVDMVFREFSSPVVVYPLLFLSGGLRVFSLVENSNSFLSSAGKVGMDLYRFCVNGPGRRYATLLDNYCNFLKEAAEFITRYPVSSMKNYRIIGKQVVKGDTRITGELRPVTETEDTEEGIGCEEKYRALLVAMIENDPEQIEALGDFKEFMKKVKEAMELTDGAQGCGRSFQNSYEFIKARRYYLLVPIALMCALWSGVAEVGSVYGLEDKYKNASNTTEGLSETSITLLALCFVASSFALKTIGFVLSLVFISSVFFNWKASAWKSKFLFLFLAFLALSSTLAGLPQMLDYKFADQIENKFPFNRTSASSTIVDVGLALSLIVSFCSNLRYAASLSSSWLVRQLGEIGGWKAGSENKKEEGEKEEDSLLRSSSIQVLHRMREILEETKYGKAAFEDRYIFGEFFLNLTSSESGFGEGRFLLRDFLNKKIGEYSNLSNYHAATSFNNDRDEREEGCCACLL